MSAMQGRPAGGADDRSALIYLINQQKGRFGEQVYLETEYHLQGDWTEISDRCASISLPSMCTSIPAT